MEGDPIEAPAAADHEPSESSPPTQLRAESVTEAARLRRCREWGTSAARPDGSDRLQASAVRGRIPRGLVSVYTLSLSAADGAVVHEEIVAIHCEEEMTGRPAFAAIRQFVSEFLRSWEPFVRQALSDRLGGHVARIETKRADAIALMAQRERTIEAIVHSAARQIVQAGLFDQRAVRAEAARARSAAGLLSALDESSVSRTTDGKLIAAFDVSAVLVARGRRRR
jgi:hypothetical protein